MCTGLEILYRIGFLDCASYEISWYALEADTKITGHLSLGETDRYIDPELVSLRRRRLVDAAEKTSLMS